ncbi:hypothetical protein [Streptomyces tropicalis]|uniref:Uncharacterized protein n=1 Tax=Streptomyces tropicalis TaxID=3034234 RepID=A0ABT6A0Y4_9ACTN|nr:hypothetical protein [Streptomyces tropicalis]MDF3298304.1 hypothetical protein [Streptomyces tropicalis]
MSAAHVPQQTQPAHAAATATPPYASEATRLLSAGTYVDAAYRDRVIDELYLNEQRIVAPSLGFDAARVLAHALRARRLELAWGGAVLGLWVVGAALTEGWAAVFAGLGLLLALAPLVRGRSENPPLYRRVPAWLLRWYGRTGLALLLIFTVMIAFGAGDDSTMPLGTPSDASFSGPAGAFGPSASVDAVQAWIALAVLALIAVCLAAHRGQVARSLAAELSSDRFPDAAGDPAHQVESERFRRMAARIRTEQHQSLVMYHEARPFCGAGIAYDTWVLAVELRPDGMKEQRPLSNRAVLETVRPLLEQLRESAATAEYPVRDRLCRLEIDECVFLPVEGLLRREDAPYHPQAFEDHRARAVEEGAEKRRHFLRVRIGGWGEELVVSVFVRVHTQGRMLMLEVAPHVLAPVHEAFKEADRTAHRYNRNNLLGKAADALSRVPRSSGVALLDFGRVAVFGWRMLTAGNAGALPEGPALSVRELGAAPSASLFQAMDVDRYLRAVQDRIAHGVRTALADAGYLTGEFVQKIVNVSNGGVNIDSVAGSTFAVGSHATASSGTVPQKGADGDERSA